MKHITATMLYNLVVCPHRPAMDLFADPATRDETSAFAEMLWEHGNAHELATIAALGEPITDLSRFRGEEKELKTTEAMRRHDRLIYSGRITADDLVGEPDLLRFNSIGYVAVDIKSGSGFEGDEDTGKPKITYAVQLAHYTNILELKGLSASGRRAFIWDRDRREVAYEFDQPQGKINPQTLWDIYKQILTKARATIAQTAPTTTPAYGAVCKQCHWYSACMDALKRTDDVTLMPDLGRAKRDAMRMAIPTMAAMATISPREFFDHSDKKGKKTVFPGMGVDSLMRFHARAKLITTGGSPYLKEPVDLPTRDVEVFFDIETDPINDLCYLHGFIERRGKDNSTQKYVAFFAEGQNREAERAAFDAAWGYVCGLPPGHMIYYYSKYERTIWRQLQLRFPDVCHADEIEALYSTTRAIDLYYDIVKPKTEWPTRDHSIKTLASYLGFRWRDTEPSGAASIEWFNRFAETGDLRIKQRILDYNEDDCLATGVVLDAVRQLGLPSLQYETRCNPGKS